MAAPSRVRPRGRKLPDSRRRRPAHLDLTRPCASSLALPLVAAPAPPLGPPVVGRPHGGGPSPRPCSASRVWSGWAGGRWLRAGDPGGSGAGRGGRGARGAGGGGGRRGDAASLGSGGRVPGGSRHGGAGPAALRPANPGDFGRDQLPDCTRIWPGDDGPGVQDGRRSHACGRGAERHGPGPEEGHPEIRAAQAGAGRGRSAHQLVSGTAAPSRAPRGGRARSQGPAGQLPSAVLKHLSSRHPAKLLIPSFGDT